MQPRRVLIQLFPRLAAASLLRSWLQGRSARLFSLPYYFCGAADISCYLNGETEQRRRASLSAADLSAAALIAPGQH